MTPSKDMKKKKIHIHFLLPEIEPIANFHRQTVKEVLEGVREEIEKLGHQQDDDTIWCNMDEVIKILTKIK